MNVEDAADALHDAAIADMQPGETPETRERDALYGTGHDPSPVEVPSPCLAQYRAELEGRKKTLEAELKAVKSEIVSVSDMVLEDFAERGVKNVKLITGETVYMHAQPRAAVKAGDWDDLYVLVGIANRYLEGSATTTERIEVTSGWAKDRKSSRAIAYALSELEGMGRWQINLNTLTAWANERIAAFNESSAGMTDAQIDAALKGPRAPLPGPLADLITLIVKPTVRVHGAKAQTPDKE